MVLRMFLVFVCLLVHVNMITLPNTDVTTVTTLHNNTDVKLTTFRSKLLINEISNITIFMNQTNNFDVVFNCTSSSPKIMSFPGGNIITIKAGTNSTTVDIKAGKHGGTIYITTELISPRDNNVTLNIPVFFLKVVHSRSLDLATVVLGWLCFASWSISFYPQTYLNWKRKSVVGLSFDFLGYNMLGWICYSAFNFSLLWVGEVKKQYYAAYPHGVINVQLSDFCFSFHALILTGITILQCLCYERGGQKPSTLCVTILVGFVCGMATMLIVAISTCMTWFQYVTIFSYVKLAVTLFKYSPQVYVNFKNKSTEAISIYQFLLDLSGGALSLLQMALIAYNYDDWKTFLGDFTKFGLALLSILYDLIFIVQHYCLYRHVPYQGLAESGRQDSERLLDDQDDNVTIQSKVNQLG